MSEPDRVSIWSIAGGWVVAFYILFSVQVAAIVAIVSWREIFHIIEDTPIDTILAIGSESAPNIFTAAAINIAIIFQAEVISMLAERYKRHRYEVGKADGIEVGKAEGIAEGIAAGKAAVKAAERARSRRYAAKLRVWAEARIKAAEEGMPFDEPMPDYDDEEDVA